MTANDLIVGVQNDNEHSIAAQGCLRIGCKDTTGLYVCNVSSFLPCSINLLDLRYSYAHARVGQRRNSDGHWQ